MRCGAAFNKRTVLRVIAEEGLIAIYNGYRIKDHIRLEHGAIFIKTGAASPLLETLIPANAWLISVDNRARTLEVAQAIYAYCKAGGDNPEKGRVKVKVRQTFRLTYIIPGMYIFRKGTWYSHILRLTIPGTYVCSRHISRACC